MSAAVEEGGGRRWQGINGVNGEPKFVIFLGSRKRVSEFSMAGVALEGCASGTDRLK